MKWKRVKVNVSESMVINWLVLLTLSLILMSCRLFPTNWAGSVPANVEVIVSNKEVKGWILSPEGDKIVYRATIDNPGILYVLFPESGQEHKLDNCSTSVLWLDNTKLLCLNNSGRSATVLTTDDFTRVRLQNTEESDVNLEMLLQNAGAIYRYEGEYNFLAEDNTIYILSPDHKNTDENFRVIVENVDEALEGYNYLIIPQQKANNRNGREQSPDGDNYYIKKNSVLKIFDAVTDEMLVEYAFFDQLVGGWASDNSGVYFQPMRGGGLAYKEFGPILKLKVPQ